MTEPSTTVLSMRLRELADDVTMVQGVLERLRQRGSHLGELNKLVSPTSLDDETIARALRNAARQAQDLKNAAENDTSLAAILEREKIDAAKLAQHVVQAQSCLREMGRILRAMTLTDLHQWRDALSENLEVCDTVLNRIDALKKELADGAAPRQVWHELRELHHHSCRALFGDYVDLLSGMVLRDTHLDDSVSAITDDFLTELSSPRLVLPGRRSELPAVFKNLVKIGFPEWTIWDVPLAAHHTGAWKADLTLPSQPGLRKLLPDRSDEVRRCLFADIYATRVAGPAYACAMLLLHLDPASATLPEPQAATGHERAHVIGRALTFPGLPGDFMAFVKRIGTDWDDAVEQNTDPPPAPNDTDALDAFVKGVRALLESRKGSPYDAKTWQAANERLAPLLRGDTAEAELRGDTAEAEQGPTEQEPSTPILDLLNAAWALRRAGASTAALEKGVMSEWRRIGRSHQGKPPPSTYRSPSGRGG